MKARAGEELARLQRIGWLFRGVNVAFREAIDTALRRSGLGMSFSQVSALSILDSHPGINGAQLARHNMVSPQAMTSVLRELTVQQLLEKREHPDSQRADSWHLTAKGQQALLRGRAAFAAVTRQMLGDLSAAQIAELEHLLNSCNHSLGSAQQRAPRQTRRAGGKGRQLSLKSVV